MKSDYENKSLGAVILCGGGSRRMGYPKWQLPLGGQSVLERIIETVAVHASPIVLSINDEGDPALAVTKAHMVVRDQCSDCGPLEGIRVSLQRLESQCNAALVTACDVPLLKGDVIALLHSLLSDEYDAVIPIDGRHVYGMTAVYRCRAHKQITRLIEQRKLRVSSLSTEIKARLVTMDEIRSVDKNAESLKNINRPEDYFSVLTELGFDCPAGLRAQLKSNTRESF